MYEMPCFSMMEKWKTGPGSASGEVPKSNAMFLIRRPTPHTNFMNIHPQFSNSI